MNDKYILVDKRPILEPDIIKWGRSMEDNSCRVALTNIGKGRVSTVFLGLDHSFGGPVPVLFETMIFNIKGLSDWQERYTTWDQAERGHKMAVRIAKKVLTNDK